MRSFAFRHLNMLLCVLLCTAMLGLLFIGVSAQPENSCQLVIDYRHEGFPLPQATFRLYRIANFGSNQELVYSDAFSDLHLDADALRNAAQELYTRVENRGILPDQTLITDSQGVVAIADLTPGAFLLVGDPVKVNGYVYYVDKQVIFLEEETLTICPKSTRLPENVELISIKTVKIWEDQGYENERPKAIVVWLLKDGKNYSSAVLSDANNWSHTWNNLLPNAKWSVSEDVPQGYTVSIQENDCVFTLTNHRKDIPQTGHIWWPVLTVFGLGLVLVVVGLSVRRSRRNEA